MSINARAVEFTENTARDITDAIYVEGRKSKGLKPDLTLEFCLELLGNICESCWNETNDYKEELGWIIRKSSK